VKVLLYEPNLIWSSRLAKSVSMLGYEPVLAADSSSCDGADLAIVDLSAPGSLDAVKLLNAKGITVFGHAGHKQKDLIAKGMDAGCSRVLSNSQISFKLGDALKESSHAR
jgi:hypothetical protein